MIQPITNSASPASVSTGTGHQSIPVCGSVLPPEEDDWDGFDTVLSVCVDSVSVSVSVGGATSVCGGSVSDSLCGGSVDGISVFVITILE
jgi:hypothetical protein